MLCWKGEVSESEAKRTCLTSGVADAGRVSVGLLVVDLTLEGEAGGSWVVRLRLKVMRVRVVGPSGDEEEPRRLLICLCRGERVAASLLAFDAVVRRDAAEERALVVEAS